MSKYLSGDELYRFLKISKRKMKYLLENGYLPMIDTGKKTHRYLILRKDAEKFKLRMETEEGFLSELVGMFNARKPAPTSKEVREKQRAAYLAELEERFANAPDALTVKQAAMLAGVTTSTVGDWCLRGQVESVMVQGVRYCATGSLVRWLLERG